MADIHARMDGSTLRVCVEIGDLMIQGSLKDLGDTLTTLDRIHDLLLEVPFETQAHIIAHLPEGVEMTIVRKPQTWEED